MIIPGYPILKRALYYCSRLIDRQLHHTAGGYDSLIKVNSIWLMYGCAKYKQGAVNSYRVAEKKLQRALRHCRDTYDLSNILLIYTNEEYDENNIDFQNLIVVLFTNQLSAEKKIEILRKQYHIEVTKKMEEDLNDMCNISMYHERVGEQRGKREGIAKGIQVGELKALTTSVKRLLEHQLSIEEAFALLGIEKEMQTKICKQLTTAYIKEMKSNRS